MKGVDAMARNQNEEAQQKPAKEQESDAASHTVLSEVMSKTMQFATTISNKIYDLSLYTGIKLVRTAKRLKKLYLFRFNKCKVEVYARLTALSEKHAAKKVDKAPKREYHPLQMIAHKRQNIVAAFQDARKQGPGAVAGQVLAYLAAGTKKGFSYFCRALNYVAPVAALCFLAYTVQSQLNVQYALEVEYDGTTVGYVQNESVFDEAQSMMNDRIIYQEGEEKVEIAPVYKIAAVSGDESLTDADTLCNTLIESSGSEIMTASGLYIDGTFVGAVTQGDELESELNAKLDAYKTGSEGEEVSFTRDVEIKDGLYSVESVVPYEQINSLINSNVSEEKTYVVQDGDAPSSIADKVGVPLLEIAAINGFENTDALQDLMYPGVELKVASSVPYLSVQVARMESWTRPIGYQTVEEESDNYYEGETEVQTEGEPGEQLVVGKVTYIDGMEVDRTEESATTTKEPVNQVILVGTKEKPVYTSRGSTSAATTYKGAISTTGSGRFIWPVNGGYYSCGYGEYYGHTGMDIAAGAGTAVYAADSGTVVTATSYGWNYGYGNYVVIDHGNGVQTLYAHNSAVYVSPGQKVSQGQQIAAVGQTGNAYGNHCHFEIIINGYKVNPAGYIGYGR